MARKNSQVPVTPARFMGPRLSLIVACAALVLFGLLMIFSASAPSAQADFGDPAYYLERQLVTVGVGIVFAVGMGLVDYHVWSSTPAAVFSWIFTVLALVMVAAAGVASHGAVRWISVAGINVQPSELAKVPIIIVAANILGRYAERNELDFNQLLVLLVLGVGLPLGLIFIQPDKGTTIIVAATILVMLYLAGIPRGMLGLLVLLGAGLAIYASLHDSYSRQRILTMLNPWADPYGTGYQLIQGWYAFGTGGLFGVGIGMSSEKYAYLPEAHNDFIFAVIGEECGLVGTLAVCVGFAVIIYAGIQIARYAPDLTGRLIAAGATSLIAIQFLVNVLGVLGLMPLSGKPLPFLSYGGSSVIACLTLVGQIVSVSRASSLPETAHDRARARMRVADGGMGRSRGSGAADPTFQVWSGGAAGSSVTRGRTSSGSGRPQRVNLGPSAADRLRGSRSSGSTRSRGRR